MEPLQPTWFGNYTASIVQASKFHLEVWNVNEELTVQTVLTTKFHLEVWNVIDEHVLNLYSPNHTYYKISQLYL